MSSGASRLCGAAAALLATLFVLPASAAVTLQNRIERSNPQHNENDMTTGNFISFADCRVNDVFTFFLTLNFANSSTLQVWATTQSTDCTDQNQRTGDNRTCGLVFNEELTEASATIDLSTQAIARAVLNSGTQGAPVCDEFVEQFPAQQGVPLALFFMLVPPGGGNPAGGDSATWSTTVDMVGPNAPTNIEAGVGENKLIMSWSVSNASGINGYRFYCDPAPGTSAGTNDLLQADAGVGGAAGAPSGSGGTSGTGTGGAAGAGTGGSAPSCGSGVLVAGEIPGSTLEPYRCGDVTGAVVSEEATSSLTNGVEYAVAVAGVDSLDNVGPLSRTVCGTPQIVDDFFELYRAAGGQGGGGFCALGATPAPGAAAALAALAAALFARRRRRERSLPS